MACFTCHTSWTTSCGGCHLPIEANWKTERHHYEGGETRNFATYNPQVARDDMFQLGRHGRSKGNKIAPVRSSSALVLSSTNINRERIYVQQPPIAASGLLARRPSRRTIRTPCARPRPRPAPTATSREANDNNAIMAQLLLQGTNFVNFVGFNAWVGEERRRRGGAGHRVGRAAGGDRQLPAPLRLSRLVRRSTRSAAGGCRRVATHATEGAARCLQLRGEYLYVAEGAGGFRVYDVASIANKGVSQKIVTAPFSPLGQDTHVAVDATRPAWRCRPTSRSTRRATTAT